jgi:hypothetical protein
MLNEKRTRSRSRNKSRERQRNKRDRKDSRERNAELRRDPGEVKINQSEEQNTSDMNFAEATIRSNIVTNQEIEASLFQSSRAGGIYIPSFKQARIYKEIN